MIFRTTITVCNEKLEKTEKSPQSLGIQEFMACLGLQSPSLPDLMKTIHTRLTPTAHA